MTHGSAGLTRREAGCVLLATGMTVIGGSCARAEGPEPYQLGTFVTAGGAGIPSDVQRVRTSGYHRPGIGAAVYVYDTAVDVTYLLQHPRSAFRSRDGRGFRLQTDVPCNPESLGLRVGLNTTFAQANKDAIAEALVLCRRIVLPAGDIDFRTDDAFILPSLDGLEIAGQGWNTRILTRDSAFLIPTLRNLTIRDLWIEQVATARSTIQSFHCNLRDIRFLRLKITMQDQARHQNNCIGLVMDQSAPGPDGVIGLSGLLIENCWFAPGRMGVEIQNHRDLKRVYGYQKVTMQGCTVWRAPIHAGMGISLSGWGADCLVTGNRFVACQGPSVEIIGGDRTHVIDNVFEDAIGAPVAASNFRVARDCRILGNRTTNAPSLNGLFLEAVDNMEVSGNKLTTRGVHVLKGSRIRLRGNEFIGSGTTQMIHLDHAQAAVIENNSFVSLGEAEHRPMIVAFSTTKDCVVRFNKMTRADYDIYRDDQWFAQGAEVRNTLVHGNERCSRVGCIKEPRAPRRTG
jgi:hypothetical protein